MMAFIGPRPDGMAINHKNGMKLDNRAENLEYCTNSENSTHAYRTGLQSRRGEKHHLRKLCEAEVRQIYAMAHAGQNQTEIAKLYGVDPSSVSNIKRRRNWSHLVYV